MEDIRDRMQEVASLTVNTADLTEAGKHVIANWLRRKALQLEGGLHHEYEGQFLTKFKADKRDKVFFDG